MTMDVVVFIKGGGGDPLIYASGIILFLEVVDKFDVEIMCHCFCFCRNHMKPNNIKRVSKQLMQF